MFNNFSPNMLKTYQTCPKKFYYQFIEKINVPHSSSPFEKGKKIHALANYNLKNVNISKIEAALNNEEKILWNRLLNNPYYQMECNNAEFPITCKIKNYWLSGRIDAIVHQEFDYYILDYKTGSIPVNPQFDFQTMVYMLCVDKYLKTYNSLSFVYIDLKEQKNHVIKFIQQLKSQYEEKIIKACDIVENDKLFNTCESNCKFCEYKKICKR